MYVCVQSFPTPAHDLLSSLSSSPVLLGVDMGVDMGVGWALLVVDVGVAVLKGRGDTPSSQQVPLPLTV